MKILMCWSDSYSFVHDESFGFEHEEFICTGDIDFEACDYKIWKLVRDGNIVSICEVDDDK